MNLVEFAEKTSPLPLTEWQKQVLMDWEQAKKEHKQLLVCMPPRTGRQMLMKIIEEYRNDKVFS